MSDQTNEFLSARLKFLSSFSVLKGAGKAFQTLGPIDGNAEL